MRFLWIIFFCGLISINAGMAQAVYDNNYTPVAGSGTNVFQIDPFNVPAGNNRMLVVVVSGIQPVIQARYTANLIALDMFEVCMSDSTQIFYLPRGTSNSPESGLITLTFTANTRSVIAAMTFQNMAQTNPLIAFNSIPASMSTGIAYVIPSNPGNLVIDVLHKYSNPGDLMDASQIPVPGPTQTGFNLGAQGTGGTSAINYSAFSFSIAAGNTSEHGYSWSDQASGNMCIVVFNHVTPAVARIPTLGQWSVLILALLLAIVGLVVLLPQWAK